MSDQIADAHLDSESRLDRMIIRIGDCGTYRPDPWESGAWGIMDWSGGARITIDTNRGVDYR